MTIQTERAARTPEERRELFAREYVKSGGKAYASAVSAGFPNASAAVRATELMKRADVQERIAELLRERFVSEGQKAHSLLIQLSKRSSQKDAVRLRAAKELMVLGGMFKKADAAAHAADAEKRSHADIVAMSKEFATGMLNIFCLEDAATGRQTGIKFSDGVYTIVDAATAGEHLTKAHHRWTVTIPAKYAAGQNPNIYHYAEEPIEEPENEDEDEDWTAA